MASIFVQNQNHFGFFSHSNDRIQMSRAYHVPRRDSTLSFQYDDLVRLYDIGVNSRESGTRLLDLKSSSTVYQVREVGQGG